VAKVSTSSSERLKRGQLRRKPKKESRIISPGAKAVAQSRENTESKGRQKREQVKKESPKIPGVRRLVRR